MFSTYTTVPLLPVIIKQPCTRNDASLNVNSFQNCHVKSVSVEWSPALSDFSDRLSHRASLSPPPRPVLVKSLACPAADSAPALPTLVLVRAPSSNSLLSPGGAGLGLHE